MLYYLDDRVLLLQNKTFEYTVFSINLVLNVVLIRKMFTCTLHDNSK